MNNRIYKAMTMNSYSISDLENLRVRINLQRIIDQNGVLKNQLNHDALNQIYFTLTLISHSRQRHPMKYTNVKSIKLLFQQVIIFNWNYEDLSPDANIAISIWSSAKQYNDKQPLGSTVISVFDERMCLRQGKYHLFVWPKVLPDVSEPSQTPGLTDDPNIATINFISDKLQEQNSALNNKTEEALKLKLFYTYRLIPAAFLQVEFPKFSARVHYQDKICSNFEQRNFIVHNDHSDFNDGVNIYDPDFEGGRLDPLQETFFMLKRQNEGNPEELLPSRQEMKSIEDIVSRSFRVELKPEEKQLFVKYRYALCNERRYLIFYLYSVQWSNHSEESEALKLVRRWQRIEKDDALHILSREFAGNSIYKRRNFRPTSSKFLRDYAVEIIADQKDDDIISIILQLVQSIRYDIAGESSMVKLLISRSLDNQQIATLFYWYLKTESEQIKQSVKQMTKNKQVTQQNIQNYQAVFQEFQTVLSTQKPQVYKNIEQQEKLVKLLRKISKGIKESKESNDKKKAQLRKKLAEIDWQSFGVTSFPMNIKIKLKAPIVAECSMFSSAMAPLKLTFETVQNIITSEGHNLVTAPTKYAFIYKNGDDLRQDQLILEMFALMDRLLKGINQDYKLTPYKTLACSKADGFVEFVSNTVTVQQIVLKDYLVKLVEKKIESTIGLSRNENIMENYIFSSAGYCAITYFFGIGDRHLENLLIDTSGKLFHIDFGFILGRDPKPYPPPIKICKEMIEAMGGSQNQNFKKFKFKCLEAYLYLRKYAKLIYNLVFLMIDSGIKDVHQEGMLKLYDKFSITMNDKQAERHFLLVLQECKNALFGQIADTIHRFATYFRD